MPVNLKGRSFLTLKDFTPDEIRYMLNLAADLKAKKRAGIRGNLLVGKNIVLLFEKTSTRTRCAFEVAAYDEGANVTFLDSKSSQMGKKETMVDTAKVLGRFYDGILMDPPSYGRGPGGEVWKLENELYGLAKACSEALSDDPLFFLINGYTTGFQASVLGNMIDMTVKPRFGGVITADEVCLPVTAGGVLPCGASGRWQRA